MIRDLLSILGGLVVAFGLVVAGVCTWCAAVESRQRHERYRPCLHTDETIDASTAWICWRCCTCGRVRELGFAWRVGTNRRTRRTA